MKIFYFIVLWSSWLNAKDVDIRVEPNPPQVGVPFQVLFEIFSTKQEDIRPLINFNIEGGKITNQGFIGTTSRATVVNGKFQVKKSYRYEYTIVAERPGVVRLLDIAVSLGDREVKIPRKVIAISKKAPKSQGFFIRTEVSKDNAFIGEGIDLRYYFYTKVPAFPQEILFFPKLRDFIKRFHMPKQGHETVHENGVTYRRFLQYSARIYPEKIGTLYIDPISLKISYNKRITTPFGALSFQLGGRQSSRSLRGEKQPINVFPLPEEGVPNGFTGLVGNHDFKFSLNKSKFLVNETIEMTLEVVGEGALEKFEPPQLLNHENLEEFEIKSELVEIDLKKVSKKFQLTYLPRNNLELEEKKVTFYTFDPNTKDFVGHSITIPPIVVVGGGGVDVSGGNKDIERPAAQEELAVLREVPFVAPSFKLSEDFGLSWVRYLNFLISFGLMIFLALWAGRDFFLKNKYHERYYLLNNVRKNFDFQGLSVFLRAVRPDTIPANEALTTLVRSLSVSQEAKDYFIECINTLEKKTYKEKENLKKPPFKKSYFKEALSLLK